jgi:hypothetical protein
MIHHLKFVLFHHIKSIQSQDVENLGLNLFLDVIAVPDPQQCPVPEAKPVLVQ